MGIISSFASNPIFSYITTGDFLGLLVYALTLLLAMCIAVSLHEWAHAFVAYKLGDPTAKNMGRMSIDPLKHISWIGLLCFLFFRIGFAKPVIVNSRNLKHYRRDDILIFLAGVVTNLLVAFVFYGVLFFTLPYISSPIYLQALSMIITLNISFAIFNILPIPPLDGFHVVSSIFIRKAYRVVSFLNRYGFIILIVLLFTGFLSTVLNWAYGGITSLFYSFYSLFI